MHRSHIYIALSLMLLLTAFSLSGRTLRLQAQTPTVRPTPTASPPGARVAATSTPTSAPGASRVTAAASPTATPRGNGASTFPPDPSTLPPCPTPGPYTGVRVGHPPQPGDSFCDARRFAQPGRGSHPAPFVPGHKPTKILPSSVSSAGPEAAFTCPAEVSHYGVGALTKPYPYPAYGSYGMRFVSNPQPGPYSQCDTIFATAHMGDNSGNCWVFQAEFGTAGCWTEVGWMWSEAAAVPCGPSLQIYTFTSIRAQQGGDGYFCFGSMYPVAPGYGFEFAIESGGPPYNYWYDYLYYNGAWQLLDWTTLTTPYTAYPGTPNIDVEVLTNYNNDGYYMTVPNDTLSQNDQVETSPGSWPLWTPQAVPGSAIYSSEDASGYGYYAAAYSPIYTWYGCGPVYIRGGRTC